MESNGLIYKLEQQFGNQYAPKRYLIIQEAIEVLKLQAEEIKALHAQIQGDGLTVSHHKNGVITTTKVKQ